MGAMIFGDRREAGRELAKALITRVYTRQDTLVLGIPRGGLVVADEVAKALSAPLDVIITRKLELLTNPNLALVRWLMGNISRSLTKTWRVRWVRTKTI